MHALTIDNLKKTYSDGTKALNGVSFTVEEGDFFALLGPNGAGKSTIINVICSLVNKSSGLVKIFDVDIDDDFPKAKSMLGIVPQEFNFSIFETVWQIVINYAGYYGVPYRVAVKRAEQVLKQLDLWGKRKSSSRTLSGGMKRRLMIARALMHKPKLLILDEPTAGVDIELRRGMWTYLRELNEQGTTIILTTHYLEEAESLCRNIAIIDHGEIVENSSMHNLLHQLDQETFIVEFTEMLPESMTFDGFDVRKLNSHAVEVEITRAKSLNDFFAVLNQSDVKVASMRNKANRLEELFIRLTSE